MSKRLSASTRCEKICGRCWRWRRRRASISGVISVQSYDECEVALFIAGDADDRRRWFVDRRKTPLRSIDTLRHVCAYKLLESLDLATSLGSATPKKVAAKKSIACVGFGRSSGFWTRTRAKLIVITSRASEHRRCLLGCAGGSAGARASLIETSHFSTGHCPRKS